jgi:class 3 adenylate cyclase
MNVDASACRVSPGFGSKSGGSGRPEVGSQCRPGSTLPGGTVTFAFTDIEESTHLLRRLGERYADLVVEHRRIIRGAFGAANGIEIDRQGDAFFFAFPRARDAVGAAVDVQRAHGLTSWPDGVAVRVRIGLHTGEPAVGEEGYLGIDVVRAARICNVARGGQILLSETTRALVRSALADGVSAVPAGVWHLKDMDGPERIYKLAVDGMETPEPDDPGEGRVQIPPGWEREIEERLGKVGGRLVANINARLADSLEANERRSATARAVVKDENLDHLAARAVDSLEDKLRAGASAALRAAHLSGRPI